MTTLKEQMEREGEMLIDDLFNKLDSPGSLGEFLRKEGYSAGFSHMKINDVVGDIFQIALESNRRVLRKAMEEVESNKQALLVKDKKAILTINDVRRTFNHGIDTALSLLYEAAGDDNIKT